MIANQNNRLFRKIYLALWLLLTIFCIGVLGFIWVENYSLAEAIYMTVITVSTVGFNEVKELSPEGRMFTSVLIVFSFGTFAYAISVVTSYVLDGDFQKLLKQLKVEKTIKSLKDHVIICGYGRNGQQAAQKLEKVAKPFVVIEMDAEKAEKMRLSGLLVVEGNATEDATLKRAGIEEAQDLIASLPSDASNLFVVLSARQLRPSINIISKAHAEESKGKLQIAGANHVIMPEHIGGNHMASLVSSPDLVEFLDSIAVDGSASSNLEELSCDVLPDHFIGKSLRDLNLRSIAGCTVVGFKQSDGSVVVNPDGDTPILSGSKLFVLGNEKQISTLKTIYEKND